MFPGCTRMFPGCPRMFPRCPRMSAGVSRMSADVRACLRMFPKYPRMSADDVHRCHCASPWSTHIRAHIQKKQHTPHTRATLLERLHLVHKAKRVLLSEEVNYLYQKIIGRNNIRQASGLCLMQRLPYGAPQLLGLDPKGLRDAITNHNFRGSS